MKKNRLASASALACAGALLAAFIVGCQGTGQHAESVVTVVGAEQDGEGTKPSEGVSENASAGGEDENALPTEKAYRASRVTLVLPADTGEDLTLSDSEGGACCVISAGGVPIATIMFPDATPYEDEHKVRRYNLGGVCTCSFSYITSDGNHAAHWGDTSATELAVTRILGMTDLVFMDCLSFGGGSQKAMEATLVSDDAFSSFGTSSGAGPEPANASDASPDSFWGIWIGASKDAVEAESIADAARAQGLEAFVTTTEEWENLNSEPWYVITAGSWASEDSARAALEGVQSAGYVDAYVKHTGAHA